MSIYRSQNKSQSALRQRRRRKRLYEERVHALVDAVPASDRGPDGRPTMEACRAIVEKLVAESSPEELQEAAEEEVLAMVNVYFDLSVKMGACERIDEDRVRKLRDHTPVEKAELELALMKTFDFQAEEFEVFSPKARDRVKLVCGVMRECDAEMDRALAEARDFHKVGGPAKMLKQ
jgi:hypothetical protein